MMEHSLTIAFLYLFCATLFGAMSVSLIADLRRNHYAHRPLRPVVLWVSLIMGSQTVHFIGLAVARFYRESTGRVWWPLDSPLWVIVLVLMATSVVGFYATFRTIRNGGDV